MPITDLNIFDRPEGAVLYGSKDLELVWLPPVWASPCLCTARSGRLGWFWLVDAVYLSWAMGVREKAGLHLPRHLLPRIDFVFSYVCATNGITDDCSERLPAPGAKLPEGTIADSAGLCDEFCGPAWPGIEDVPGPVRLRAEVFDPLAYRKSLADQQYRERRKSAPKV